MKGQSEIYCPKCEWVPGPLDTWSCELVCGCLWNTFATHGVCPNCGKHWEDTQCLNCHEWSAHADWYHDLLESELEESAEIVVQA